MSDDTTSDDTMSDDCSHNADPLRLVREGTSQDGRRPAALDPASAPLDERTPAHGMVFARAHAAFLRYFDNANQHAGDWQPFFAADPAVQLALAAVQDPASYQAAAKARLAWLDDMANEADEAGLRTRLGELFAMPFTLAVRLDGLLQGLLQSHATGSGLREELRNLVKRRLAPALKSLLLYHRDGLAGSAAPPLGPYLEDGPAPLPILGAALTAAQARHHAFAPDWIHADPAADWPAYLARIDDDTVYPVTGGYGSGPTLFARVNHLATHNLFTGALDSFFRAHARVVVAARGELDASLRTADHEPHYALFLAFLRLLDTTRGEYNTFTARHLDFYYREVLRLRPAGAQPGQAHLLAELARLVPSHLLARGTAIRAGKDALAREAFFELTGDTVVNQGKLAALHALYRHGDEPVTGEPGTNHAGRLFAAPVINSADGIGAPLEEDEPSWHPFHIKRYRDGALERIAMPPAEVGFALASHHLLLAEGERFVRLDVALAGTPPAADYTMDVRCLLTGPEGWIDAPVTQCRVAGTVLRLDLYLAGDAAPVVPYAAELHGGAFDVRLPILQVLLRHRPAAAFPYAAWQGFAAKSATLAVTVLGARALTVSNDFGPLDTSKPFQPFGPAPAANATMVIGSREAFQKTLTAALLTWAWQAPPDPYKTAPEIAVDYLAAGQWQGSGLATVPVVGSTGIYLPGPLAQLARDGVDLSAPALYDNGARRGYLRLRLDEGFGAAQHQADLIAFLKDGSKPDPGPPRPGPAMTNLQLSYAAQQAIPLQYGDAAAYDGRPARFFHVGPFGKADLRAFPLRAAGLPLLPAFGFGPPAASDDGTAGALFLGIADLAPPCNLALLFEVAPGTADPLARKPEHHVQWSWLRRDEWLPFGADAVVDGTSGLIRSGIVTLDMPRDADTGNTLYGAGLHWIRASVATRVDAVCRLLLVAPQALHARFADRGNDPAFPATPLPAGSITKLAVPDPAVKKLSQPFAVTGGRGAETQAGFALRVSERLRHKDRAIALWDVEHLVLQAFPQIYKVKCLNHTQYEPADDGTGIYRELAPGHVTVVTIPDARLRNVRDPLKPYTSLDLLEQVGQFLRSRMSCFATLHVRNPQLEEVRVAFNVKLLDGYDETFHVNLLKETVTRFLSPWAWPGGGNPSFGGRVHKSVLIDLVEEQPYVDYVTDFRLFHDIGGVRSGIDRDDVAGSLAVAILVSVPAPLHEIAVLHPAGAAGAPERCPCEAT